MFLQIQDNFSGVLVGRKELLEDVFDTTVPSDERHRGTGRFRSSFFICAPKKRPDRFGEGRVVEGAVGF